MTEPDEALLWAREQCATDCNERGFSHVAERYRRGAYDNLFEGDARAYRAGAAASAERIKALEAALEFYADSKNWRSPSSGFALQYDPQPPEVQRDSGRRALLALAKSKGVLG